MDYDIHFDKINKKEKEKLAMTKKKIISVLITLVMLMSMAACGQKSESQSAGQSAQNVEDTQEEIQEDTQDTQDAETDEEEPDLDQFSSTDEKEIIFWNLWGGVTAKSLNQWSMNLTKPIQMVSKLRV